jgi:hypothetical protein
VLEIELGNPVEGGVELVADGLDGASNEDAPAVTPTRRSTALNMLRAFVDERAGRESRGVSG